MKKIIANCHTDKKDFISAEPTEDGKRIEITVEWPEEIDFPPMSVELDPYAAGQFAEDLSRMALKMAAKTFIVYDEANTIDYEAFKKIKTRLAGTSRIYLANMEDVKAEHKGVVCSDKASRSNLSCGEVKREGRSSGKMFQHEMQHAFRYDPDMQINSKFWIDALKSAVMIHVPDPKFMLLKKGDIVQKIRGGVTGDGRNLIVMQDQLSSHVNVRVRSVHRQYLNDADQFINPLNLIKI